MPDDGRMLFALSETPPSPSPHDHSLVPSALRLPMQVWSLHFSHLNNFPRAFSCCTSDTDRDLIPKHYDWSKHQYQDDESYIELIAELKFNNRLRDKLNHFGMSVTYFARKFDVAKSFWSIFNAAPHWVNIQHWIDGKFELGHIIPQSIFVPSNIIHGNMANNPTNFFILWVQVLTILASILIATMDPLMIRMGVGCSA